QVLVAGCPTGGLPLPPELLAEWYGMAGNAEGWTELAKAYTTQPVPHEVLERFGRDAARVPLAALRGTMDIIASASFAAAPVPTLVVGGLSDALFTPEFLRDEVVGPIPGARLELVDAGHEIPVERPRELAALIEAFVEEVAFAPSGSAGSAEPLD